MDKAGDGKTVRVFIGTEAKTEIACQVLKCSLQQRTHCTVLFTDMIGPEWEYDLGDIKVGTGFSLRRWMIPAACGYNGKAIYLDADQLVFGDIWELWNADKTVVSRPNTAAWMTYQPSKFSQVAHPNSSVMLMDCEQMRQQQFSRLDKILAYLRKHREKQAYADLMYPTWMKPAPGVIDTSWNHLNEFHMNRTKLLHYTKEPEQPWYKPDHPLARLWENALDIAIQLGYVTKPMLEKALGHWGVQEDWRKTNGLHPHYAKYLKKFDVRDANYKKGQGISVGPVIMNTAALDRIDIPK